MKNIFKILCMGIFLFSVLIAKADQNSPVGYWDQYGDKSGQLQSIIQIWQDGNQLKGKVIKGFPVNGKAPNHYCTKCSGQFKNKRITDLTMIWGLQQSNDLNKWTGGHILDPESGNIYRLNATLINGGQQLSIRAYLGITLLGRTQTWTRITEAQMKQQLADIYKVIGNN